MPSFPPSKPTSSPLVVRPPNHSFKDAASHSRPGLHFTDHIDLNFHLDFCHQLITSTATYTIRILDPGATTLILDSRGNDIDSITTPSSQHPLQFSLENTSSPIGASLHIDLPSTLPNPFQIVIKYTSPGNGAGHSAGGALHWLVSTSQTADKPFAFTQCQSIHARSIVPCQDTPAVKSTYSATVRIAEPYQDLTVVMSAQRVESDDDEVARFQCNVPVPSYLIAMAIGNLHWRPISDRCAVWALPDVVDKAAWEFGEVEDILKIAENVAGKYVWGRYDLLVLPPAFPYGGMENPFLTFVTPTLLAGDRSLVSVVVHEIAHSWTGNLVSCQSCKDFWLNEGFTVKLERKILREMYGHEREGLDATKGRQVLDTFIKNVGEMHIYTSLVAKLKDGCDPDDYFSCVSYEKGYNFLLWLEHLVSQSDSYNFHDFLKDYIDKYKYQSITSQDFVSTFTEKYPDLATKIDFDTWLYGVGFCPNLAPLDSSLVDTASSLAGEWVDVLIELSSLSGDDANAMIKEKFGKHSHTFNNWDSVQKLCFLNELRSLIDKKRGSTDPFWTPRAAGLLQTTYGFNEARNSEIRFMWCQLAIAARYEPVLQNVEEFLTSQGRMKYVRPLLNDLHIVYPRGDFATNLFLNVKDSYHTLCAKMVERDLQRSSRYR